MISIDIKMPDKCGDCPCFHHENPMYCQAVKADKNKRINAPYGFPRPEWCPLKEQDLKEQDWNIITEDADGLLHGWPGDDGMYIMTDGRYIWIDEYVDGVEDGIFLDSGTDIREIKAWKYMPELPTEGKKRE